MIAQYIGCNIQTDKNMVKCDILQMDNQGDQLKKCATGCTEAKLDTLNGSCGFNFEFCLKLLYLGYS